MGLYVWRREGAAACSGELVPHRNWLQCAVLRQMHDDDTFTPSTVMPKAFPDKVRLSWLHTGAQIKHSTYERFWICSLGTGEHLMMNRTSRDTLSSLASAPWS